MLHALYPGRIDLGIGRAPGGSPLEAYDLQRTRNEQGSPDDFPAQLTELLNFLHGGFPANHPFNRITVSPQMPGAPEVWLLGSSPWSAAAFFGLPYAFAHFIDPQPTRVAVEQYRFQFKPSRYMSAPRALVALGVLCADSEEEAQRLLMSARLFRRRIRQGLTGPIPTIEEAIRELGPPVPRPNSDDSEWPRYFAGAPEQVRDQLAKMATALQLEEIMVVTIVHDHQARRRSYELLSEVFNLSLPAHKVLKNGS